jgi:hypothetical protein
MKANINNKVESGCTYSTEEICNKIAELFVTQNEYGDILVAGVPDTDSILDSRKFCKAVVAFVEAVKHTDPYNALSALAYIVSWAEVDNLIEWLGTVRPTDCEWLNVIKWEDVVFEDYLLNTVWQNKRFNKRAAVLLYGMASYLADARFDLRVYNYNGDIASLSVATENASVFFKEEF